MYMNNQDFSRTPARRGFVPLYHADTINHCPACTRTHWHIGRSTAECAFCETAIPLAVSAQQPTKPLFWFRGSETLAAA